MAMRLTATFFHARFRASPVDRVWSRRVADDSRKDGDRGSVSRIETTATPMHTLSAQVVAFHAAAVTNDRQTVPDTVPDEAPAATFEEFVRRHHAELYGRAKRLCRGHLDADDVLQDALERAWKAYGEVRDRAAGRAWLFTILNHTFIDRVRRQQARPPMDHLDGLEVRDEGPPATERWAVLDVEDLRAAVAELPDDVRDIYRLHALEGRDYAWLAERFGMPKNSVGTRLLRARKRLREILEARLARREGGAR
jgi:RNA polymerase sigma-70 factor (ECF subfamily)